MKNNRRDFLQMTAGLAASGLLSSSIRDGVAQEQPRPNFLFFFPDQHRFDWTGLNPAIDVDTPHINGLAERGVQFTNAYCPSPVCAPSRACLASGREYPRCGVAGNGFDYPIDQVTFYELLRNSGYHVTGCGKFDLHKASKNWGVDGKTLLTEWGFSDGIDNAGKYDAINSGRVTPRDPYMAYLEKHGLRTVHIDDFSHRNGPESYTNVEPTKLPDHAYCDNWIAENGLTLLRNAPKGNPWFLQINFTGPHNPLDITQGMDAGYKKTTYPQPNHSTQYDQETHNAIRRNYSAMVTNIDRWLGIYIEELKQRGELENTIIVYSSDHGEMLGDHDLWAKSKPHQPSIAVPLVMAGPGINQKVQYESPVSLIDLTATFLDYSDVGIPNTIEGTTLRGICEGKQPSVREHVFSALNPFQVVSDGEFKLAVGYGAPDNVTLHNLKEDPLENNDISKKAGNHVKRLMDVLNSFS